MSRVSYLVALIVAVAACGGSSKEPAKPASPPAARTADDVVPMCKRHWAHKVTCTDDYLPALLDLRVELNKPAGIGDEVKTQGRDAMLATARTEFARDSEPAKVEELCGMMATKMPPERVDQVLDQADKCEAAADCKAFATCAVAIDRGFIAGGPPPQAATASPH
jgi:hypothetical protein